MKAYYEIPRAPFPWFGGKNRAAGLIWDRFGNVPNYVEPFAGSLAVLLARPHQPKTETVNDLDCYLSNFWRAVKADPQKVADYADWPVNEADMLARHKWLLCQAGFRDRLRTEPEYFDARIAGWWVWGINIWIGAGWCIQEAEQLPHLGNPGTGMERVDTIHIWFQSLSRRLRDVRICCGQWDRVLGESVTVKHGLTAVLLDPPYSGEQGYAATNVDVTPEVRTWAVANGDHPLLRIALCGYRDDYQMPNGWERVAWKQRKGYQKVRDGTHSGHDERIWFSPHCIRPGLFRADETQRCDQEIAEAEQLLLAGHPDVEGNV